MPTIHGRLDDLGFPVIELLFVGGQGPLTAVLDTGFDGELLLYYDDLLGIGLEPRVDRVVQGRLADGTEATLLGAPKSTSRAALSSSREPDFRQAPQCPSSSPSLRGLATTSGARYRSMRTVFTASSRASRRRRGP